MSETKPNFTFIQKVRQHMGTLRCEDCGWSVAHTSRIMDSRVSTEERLDIARNLHPSCPKEREEDPWEELSEIVAWMDDYLDGEAPPVYRDTPLAQDWARVAKVTEEAGEAVDALIGMTGQNPRKGHYGGEEELLNELADVALTGMYAMRHFTKNAGKTLQLVLERARYHKERVDQ